MQKTGFPEMHLTVDDTGEDVEVAAVQCFSRNHARHVTNRNNPAIFDRDVTDPGSVLIDNLASFQHQVHVIGHRAILDTLCNTP